MNNFLPIGNNNPVYVIAEMSGNHNQSKDTAFSIIKEAKNIGVSAIKLQTYTPDTLTLDLNKKDFLINNKSSIWHGQKLYNLYKKAYTDWGWIEELYSYSKSINLTCFSSVFDKTSVDFWEALDPLAYKIASFENNHLPLIKYVAETKRPLIISTGLANLKDIDAIVDVALSNGCPQLVLLKCTSDYPARNSDSNLLTIPFLRNRYGLEIGLSDHTLGNEASIASIALGATVLEKHIVLNNSEKTVDSEFSASVDEFSELIKSTKIVKESLGKVTLEPSDNEKKNYIFKRSIYAIKNIKKGQSFTDQNIAIIRPGFGLNPKYYSQILGSTSKHAYNIGDRIKQSEVCE